MNEDPREAARSRPHVVIVGGGFAGLGAARALRKVPVRVTLLDARNHHLFQPLLYQVAMAGLSPADIAAPIRSILRGQRHTEVLLGEVASIDLSARRVHTKDGISFDYDYVVIAAGARTNYFGKEHSFARHSLALKNIEDALEIRRRVLLAFEAAERASDPAELRRLLTFVVIGGGPTGVEIAGALRELARFVLAEDFRHIDPAQAKIILIEAGDRILPGGFDARLSKAALVELSELGVEVRLSAPVERIDERGVQLRDEVIEAATVLWTAGVRAESLANTLGADLDALGRIIVASDCSIPRHPEAFALGDIARFVSDAGDPLPGLAPVAMQQGRYVGGAIRNRIAGRPIQPFVYRDKGIMATIGRSRAVTQVRSIRLKGFLAWLIWLAVHIWYLIGFRNRMIVMFEWFWNYVTYRRGARLITGRDGSRVPLVSAPTADSGAAATADGERHAELAGRLESV